MKAQELKLKKDGYNLGANCRPKGSHVSLLLRLGGCFPTCKSQAKKFTHLGVLNFDDVLLVESMLNKYGFAGDYRHTKSKQWVRLNNIEDLKISFKKEYNF